MVFREIGPCPRVGPTLGVPLGEAKDPSSASCHETKPMNSVADPHVVAAPRVLLHSRLLGRVVGSPSWQLIEGEGDRAHVLLYIRDVAALEVPAEVDAPPRLVGCRRTGPGSWTTTDVDEPAGTGLTGGLRCLRWRGGSRPERMTMTRPSGPGPRTWGGSGMRRNSGRSPTCGPCVRSPSRSTRRRVAGLTTDRAAPPGSAARGTSRRRRSGTPRRVSPPSGG
jgi:hypothetical protein